jgi:hypothetical protein
MFRLVHFFRFGDSRFRDSIPVISRLRDSLGIAILRITESTWLIGEPPNES